MIIRRFEDRDCPQLIALWQTVFGDSEAFVCDFLDYIVFPGRGFVAEIEGMIAAAAYIIDGINVSGTPHPYIYAVSTLPEFRGRGYGEAVSRACAELISAEGGKAALHPAEESLFAWYGKMGFYPAVSVYEGKITATENAIEITPLSPAAYAEKRRRLLCGTSFADFDTKLLDWWQKNWKAEFYGFNSGCMAVLRVNENDAFVPELIATEKAVSALSALGVKEICVRTPELEGFEHFGSKKDFISVFGAESPCGYWGFAFD